MNTSSSNALSSDAGEELSLATRVVSNKRSAACDLNGEMVILQLDSGVYFGLSGVGGAVWSNIQNEKSIGDLIDQLLSEYNVTRAVCEAQVLALLQDMAAHKLIDIRGEGTPDGAAV